jgi:hypothetical protein
MPDHRTTQQKQLDFLRADLEREQRRLRTARPRDVAGASSTAHRESAQRKIDRIIASIARVEAQG